MACTATKQWSVNIKTIFFLGVSCSLLCCASSQCTPCACSVESSGKYKGKKSINCKNKKLLLIPSNVPSDVEVWWLGNNNISTISDNFFQGRSNVLQIDLSYNSLTSLSEKTFSGLTGLRKLNLYANKLSVIQPKTFSSLPSLEAISLGVNRLSRIPDRLLESMPKLKEVDLNNNFITHIPPNTFDGTTNVVFLFIANNKLSVIARDEFSKIAQLAFVDLSRNQISAIDSDAFDGSADVIIHLNIQENNLTQLPTTLLKKMSGIQELLIGHNEITHLTYHDLQALNKTYSIDLGPNPFECNCELKVVQEWFNSTLVSVEDKDTLTCQKGNVTEKITQYNTRLCDELPPTKPVASSSSFGTSTISSTILLPSGPEATSSYLSLKSSTRAIQETLSLSFSNHHSSTVIVIASASVNFTAVQTSTRVISSVSSTVSDSERPTNYNITAQVGPSPTVDIAPLSKEKILITSISVGIAVSLSILVLLGLYIYFESVRPRTRSQGRRKRSDDDKEDNSTSSGLSIRLKHEVVPLQTV